MAVFIIRNTKVYVLNKLTVKAEIDKLLKSGFSSSRGSKYDSVITCQNGHTMPRRYIKGGQCVACYLPKSIFNGSQFAVRQPRIKEPVKPIDELPRSRKEAVELGFAHYFTENKCKKGHFSPRNKSNGKCLKCERERSKRTWARLRDNKYQRASIYAANHLSRGVTRTTPRNIDKPIAGLGYTRRQLINHLESQFTPEMTWANYGSYWEIDHIKPRAEFVREQVDDLSIINALQNLRPLEVSENKLRAQIAQKQRPTRKIK